MRDTTLCFLVNEKEILLAMKKRGFGVNRWNGVGGKVQEGESIEDAALRELGEEVGVTAREESLEKVATLKFYFPHRPEWSQNVHVFFLNTWEGVPNESEEMKPQWFSHDSLPFHAMWPDDPHWLPRVLAGQKLNGDFYFADDGNTFTKFEIHEV